MMVLRPYLYTLIFFFMLRPPPISTLFPYTTLFRSHPPRGLDGAPVDLLQEVRHRLGDEIDDPEAHRLALGDRDGRSEEHTSELQSRGHLVCRLLLEKKKQTEPVLEKRTNQRRE